MESQGVLLTSVGLGKAHPTQSKGEDADRNRNGVIATEEKKNQLAVYYFRSVQNRHGL